MTLWSTPSSVAEWKPTDLIEAMERWRREKPGRTRKEFIRLRLKKLMSEPSQKPSMPDVTGPVTQSHSGVVLAQLEPEQVPIPRKRKK